MAIPCYVIWLSSVRDRVGRLLLMLLESARLRIEEAFVEREDPAFLLAGVHVRFDDLPAVFVQVSPS